MSDPAARIPIGGLQRAGSPAAPAARAATPEQAASFQSLLEQLEQKAEALGAKAHGELAPQDLAQAVDEARSSLEDVLALQDRLLEAWRQSRHQPAPGPAPRAEGAA